MSVSETYCLLTSSFEILYRIFDITYLFSRSRQVRERLETAFHVVEKEYGVTRLLDPEGEILSFIDRKFNQEFSIGGIRFQSDISRFGKPSNSFAII